MSSTITTPTERMTGATPAFVLSAAITVVFNTALAWIKDAYPAVNNLMKSMTGHHWTTHGLADLLLFLGLGFLFMSTKTAEKMDPKRLNSILIGAVVIAAAGLALWYVLF